MASKEHTEYQQEGMKKYLTNFKYPHAGEKEPRLISLMDTCVARGAMGGIMGGGLGVVFGLLMSAGGPMGSMAASPPIPGMPPAFPPPAAGPNNAPAAASILRGATATASAASSASSSAAAPFLSTPPSVLSVRPPVPAGMAASAAVAASFPVAASSSAAAAAAATSSTVTAIRPSLGPQPLPAPMLPTVPFSDPIYGSNANTPDINSWASMKTMMKETGKQAKGNFKTWGIMSGSFAVSECVIEQARGTSDQWNGLAAGCTTGALLAARSGPQGMALGCAGFASFSFAMEQIMHAMG